MDRDPDLGALGGRAMDPVAPTGRIPASLVRSVVYCAVVVRGRVALGRYLGRCVALFRDQRGEVWRYV